MSPTLCHYSANSLAASDAFAGPAGTCQTAVTLPQIFSCVDPSCWPFPSPLFPSPPLPPPLPVVWHFLHDSLSPNCTCCCLGKGLQRECNSQWPIEFVQAPSAMDETSTRENKDLEENWIKGLRREASWQVSDTKTYACKRIKSQL